VEWMFYSAKFDARDGSSGDNRWGTFAETWPNGIEGVAVLYISQSSFMNDVRA